jgi:hypothetical protein
MDGIYAAVLGAPFVKRDAAHAMLSQSWLTGIPLSAGLRMPRICELV